MVSALFLEKERLKITFIQMLLRKKTGKEVEIDDFTDVKSLYDDKIYGLVNHMTVEQILERDRYYDDNGAEKHELLEILEEMLRLTQ